MSLQHLISNQNLSINPGQINISNQPFSEYYISGLTGDFTNPITGDGSIVYSAVSLGATSLLWSPTKETGAIGYTAGYWTANISGRYLAQLNCTLTGITAGHNFGKIEFYHYLANGNSLYKSFYFNPAQMAASNGQLSTSFTWLLWMNAGDEMSFIWTISGGQKVVTFSSVDEQYNQMSLMLLG